MENLIKIMLHFRVDLDSRHVNAPNTRVNILEACKRLILSHIGMHFKMFSPCDHKLNLPVYFACYSIPFPASAFIYGKKKL